MTKTLQNEDNADADAEYKLSAGLLRIVTERIEYNAYDTETQNATLELSPICTYCPHELLETRFSVEVSARIYHSLKQVFELQTVNI